MGRLTVRLPAMTIQRLDALATERGTTRSQIVRDGVEALVAGQPLPDNPLTEDEILALLRERARAGNVSALRALLAREESTDPHQRALVALREMAERQ